MAGAAFSSSGFNAVAGAPKAAKPKGVPKAPGASLTGLRVPPAPLSGQAIAGNHPNWYGPQGASFTQTGAATAPAKPQVPPPAASKPVTSGTTTTPPASPLDSTYFGNIAANNLRVGNQINGLITQGQNSTTNLQDALAQLAYQQPRDQLNVEEAANRRGALYSSVEGQQQGNLLNTYQTKQSGLTQANAQRQAAIASQISGLQQGQPLYAAGQYDAAVARAIKAAAANPATGQAPISTPAKATPATPAPAKKASKPAPLSGRAIAANHPNWYGRGA